MNFTVVTSQFWSLIVSGLALGFIYVLISLGYTMVYGVLRLINFANSEIFMVGTFATVVVSRNFYKFNQNTDPLHGTKLVLVLCPEWSPYMPPFSLARLSGVAKSAGYETHIMDLNVKAYNAYRDDWQPNKKLPFRLWDPSSSWHWLGETYLNDIHPVLEPILSEAVDKIIEMNPEVVGFSLYYTNEQPSNWMARELRKRLPGVKIIAPDAPALANKISLTVDGVAGEQLVRTL